MPCIADEQTCPSSSSAGQVPALNLVGLYKAFGETIAVDHIDLRVPAGAFYGLVGPNGAGKSTALSMAIGLLRPDAGIVRILGVDAWKEPVRAKKLIGALPDGLSLPEYLTGREILTYLGLLRGMEPDVVDQRAADLLAVLQLTDAERTLVIDYSTGMRKQLGLATALLHNPRLLILDEPLEAVDPVSASTIESILRRFVAAGGSVIFSSHVMALVEQLCDQVAVIAKGRVVTSGSLEQVRDGMTLERRFARLVGAGFNGGKELPWLGS
jgi:ABC-2 type transport system ATP-binding protein